MFVHHHDPSVLLVHVHMYKLDLCGKGTRNEIYRVPPERKRAKKGGKEAVEDRSFFLGNLKTPAKTTSRKSPALIKICL